MIRYGLPCAIVPMLDEDRYYEAGWVKIPQGHRWFGKNADYLNRRVSVHGGITAVRADGWIGFHAGHPKDVWSVWDTGGHPKENWWGREKMEKQVTYLAYEISREGE